MAVTLRIPVIKTNFYQVRNAYDSEGNYLGYWYEDRKDTKDIHQLRQLTYGGTYFKFVQMLPDNFDAARVLL